MKSPSVLVAVLVVTASGLAGCVGGGDGGETLKGGTSDGSPATSRTGSPNTGETEEDEEMRLGQRWHFHNYWGTSPVLTLFDGDVTLDASKNPDLQAPPPRATVGSAEFRLPYGTIVPPETGTVTVTLDWPPLPLGLDALNVSYRHATAEEFLPVGTVLPGQNVTIPVSYDQTDAAHTSRSAWEFRFTPVANEAGLGVANGTVHALIVAKIGRPIFIDPPHIDHWQGTDTVSVVDVTREVHGAKTPVDAPAPAPLPGVPSYVTLEPSADAPSAKPGGALIDARAANGSVVPEGAKTLLARLTWDAPLPPEAGKPSLWYAEDNGESSGFLEPETDEAGERVYRLPLVPSMTDSPYGNQSTWRFQVHLDADAAAAFSGTVRLEAWATRLPPAEAAPP